jgi:lysozyme
MTSANGIDISSWQHPAGVAIDWDAVAKSGKQFVIIKSSQGVSYTNPNFRGDAAAAREAGLLVGAYHYATPAVNSAADEAAFALNAVQGVTLDLGLALDLEDIGAMPTNEVGTWAEAFLTAIGAIVNPSALYTYQSLYVMLMGAPWGHPLWKADPDGAWLGDCWMRQGAAGEVTGIIGQVDQDVLTNIRGANPGPSGPPALPPGPPVVTPPPPPVEVPPAPPVGPQPTQEVTVQVPQLSVTDPGPNVVSASVKAIQSILSEVHGWVLGPAGIDGRFGPGTEQAVKNYQGQSGLVVDGIVGEATWTKLCGG